MKRAFLWLLCERILCYAQVFTSKSSLLTAVDAWVADQVSAISTYGDISLWDVSAITDMSWLFCGASDSNCRSGMRSFQGNISTWDVSNVVTMEHMFTNAESFNININSWNVSQVTNMRWMFASAISFNQPLDNWDVGNVENMDVMFHSASNFDQPLPWNVVSVTNMNWIFLNCDAISNCNKAVTNAAFSSNSLWACSSPYCARGSSWSQYLICSPPPLPPQVPPPSPPTTFYIRGDRSQIVFGTNEECTIEHTAGASSLTSTCPITTATSRRLKEASNDSDRMTELEAKTAQLEMDKAEMKQQIQFVTTELKMLKEQRKAP